MANPAVYVVRTTLNPGVQISVPRAEYDHLVELGVVQSLDSVTVPADQILIQTTTPVAPQVGQVWFNTSAP